MEGSDHRSIAIQEFNRCWELLEKSERSASEGADLLTSAFASRFHWSVMGESERTVMDDWMVSRAAAANSYGDLAVQFALRAHEGAVAARASNWLIASVAEGLARAYDAAGDTARRDEWWTSAEILVGEISDEKDRELIESQLKEVPH